MRKNWFIYFAVSFSYGLVSASVTIAQPVLYPAPSGLSPSEQYSVKVNGKNAFVYASPIPAAYCSFDMNSVVEITIKANRDIKWVDIRPLALGIKPIFKDSTIHFKLSKPAQLSIELNGSIKMPLFIFANAPEKNKPNKNDTNVLFFEAGKIHYPGIINLQSNQTLYVEGGAVVVGVVKASHAKHIRIGGRGILDGTFNFRFNDSLIKTKNIDAINANKSTGKYQRFLEFTNCDDVKIEGITLHNSTSWQVVPLQSKNVEINNIKIISDQASDDGIDVVHSKNVHIHHCFIRTKDDCIAIKAYIANPPGPDVDSILIDQCVFWNALWGNGFEIGFELNSAAVKNITFKNSDIIHIEAGAAFSIHNAGAATVSNVLFDNIRVEDARQKLFDLAIFRSQYSVDGTRDTAVRRKLYLNGAWDGVLMIPAEERAAHAIHRGKIKDVVFRNIKIVDGLFPYSVFYGYDAYKNVSNVLIENLQVHGKRITNLRDAKLYLENASNILVE